MAVKTYIDGMNREILKECRKIQETARGLNGEFLADKMTCSLFQQRFGCGVCPNKNSIDDTCYNRLYSHVFDEEETC